MNEKDEFWKREGKGPWHYCNAEQHKQRDTLTHTRVAGVYGKNEWMGIQNAEREIEFNYMGIRMLLANSTLLLTWWLESLACTSLCLILLQSSFPLMFNRSFFFPCPLFPLAKDWILVLTLCLAIFLVWPWSLTDQSQRPHVLTNTIGATTFSKNKQRTFVRFLLDRSWDQNTSAAHFLKH